VNPLDKLKVFTLVDKCKNAGLFKGVSLKRNWTDKDGDENAEVIVTTNNNKEIQLTVMLKNGVILAAIPLSNIGL